MKILLTGSSGQLGQEIISQKPSSIELIQSNRNSIDLQNPTSCLNAIDDSKPDWIINCGAYTNVEKAEIESNKAMQINALAPKIFAKKLKLNGGKILQISTDYVFDGTKNIPYRTLDKKNPINTYGLSKSKAEDYIEGILTGTNQGLILRSSWVMGSTGKNFALTMIKLHQEKKNIKVVSDQFSSPTSTNSLATACWRLIDVYEKNIDGNLKSPRIFHWSDSGIASWYEIAIAVGEIALEEGLIKKQAKVIPISTSEYLSKTKRPSFSCLDCTSTSKFLNLNQKPWKKGLRDVIKKIDRDKLFDKSI